MAILRRTEKAMMKAMCGVKIIEKRRSQELVSLLGLMDTLDRPARASGVRWYGHALRGDNGDVLRRALDFELAGKKGRGRPNMTWKRQVEEHINQIGLEREDAIDRVKWRNGVYELPRTTRRIRSSALTPIKLHLKNWISLSLSFCFSPKSALGGKLRTSRPTAHFIHLYVRGRPLITSCVMLGGRVQLF